MNLQRGKHKGAPTASAFPSTHEMKALFAVNLGALTPGTRRDLVGDLVGGLAGLGGCAQFCPSRFDMGTRYCSGSGILLG